MTTDPWELGWEAIGSIATAASIAMAVWIFRRDAATREFEICDRLEKESTELWKTVTDSESSNLADLVQRVFDHYERCAIYLNQFHLMKGRAARGLEQGLVEVVRRELPKPEVRAAIKACCSSTETYRELKDLLARHNVYLPVGL